MFYICGLEYNNKKLRCAELFNGMSTTNDWWNKISCSLDKANEIKVGVFDTRDSVVEWYTVADLVDFVKETNIEIKGLNLGYGLNILTSCKLNVTLPVPSLKYREAVAKLKLAGIDITEDGVLHSYNPSFCKGGTISFPDEVFYIDRDVFTNIDWLPANKFIVGSNLDLESVSYVTELLKPSSNNTVIFNSDVHIPLDLFCYIKSNIFSRGMLTLDDFNKVLKDLNNLDPASNYAIYRELKGRKFYLADKYYIHTLDFINCKVYTVKNNGTIKY